MKEISTGRFLRIILILIFISIAYFVLNNLSEVLLPFLAAWLLAYLLYPIVKFFQYRLRLRYRLLSIIVVLLLLTGILTGIFLLVVPSIINELVQLKGIVMNFISNRAINPSIPPVISNIIQQYAEENHLTDILQNSGVQDMIKSLLQKTWFFAMGTINIVIQAFVSCIALLYLFFILLDYERLAEEWQTLIPPKWRDRVNTLTDDLTEGMNQYFRGQSLIALIVGILFSIGFLIIDFPVAIGFGLFIGVLNLVPYLQLTSLLPMTLLALAKAANTGENFWIILFSALAVTLIIQAIQDLLLVPHIMGKRMKLHPAIILLSLAIWGKLLGVIGMIVALPLTNIFLGYFKQYHQRKAEATPGETVQKQENAKNIAHFDKKSSKKFVSSKNMHTFALA